MLLPPSPELAEQTLLRLSEALRAADARAAQWLVDSLASTNLDGIRRGFALAGRKFGRAPLELTLTALPTPEGGWDAATVARLALLLGFARHSAPGEQQRLVGEVFYKGDSPERIAVLRGLSLLTAPDAHVLVATDGVRSHVQPVFEAIACENPYGARYLGDGAFNQLVMKAYFTEVPVRRIVGLRTRLNADLQRMAADYAAERRAAGRPLPQDLEAVVHPVH